MTEVPRVVYLDASALAKLVVEEAETAALQAYLADRPERVTSILARVEVARALRRAGADRQARLEAVIEALTLIGLARRHRGPCWSRRAACAPDPRCDPRRDGP